MEKIILNKDLNTPLYIQLYESLKTIIENREFTEEKLPSIRKMAKSLDVNNVTIISAYNLLEQEGYVYSIKGSGTYINISELDDYNNKDIELMTSGILSIAKDSLDFASISPTEDFFPVDRFKEAMNEVLDRDRGKAFLYPEIIGYEGLRESISDFILEDYNIHCSKDQILITSGGQQGLDIIAKTLIKPGDSIIVENPTYSGAIAAFKSRGANIIGVPMEEDGINTDLLDDYIKKYRPKFIYIMSNYQSPTTYSYSLDKKLNLLYLAKEYDIHIIEDDFLTDLYFSNKNMPLKAMDQDDRVIFIKSFSKIFMPGIRMGFITLPDCLFKNIIKSKHSTDVSSSGFLQRSFDLYLRKGYWKSHIDFIRDLYEDKYNTMVNQLELLKPYGLSYTKPDGGLSIWVRLPANLDAYALYEVLREDGLAIVPGKIFFVDDSIYSNYIRLSFSTVTKEEIIEGINILKNSIHRFLNEDNNKYMPFI